MAALVAAAPTPAPAVPAERRRDLPSSPAFRASSQVGMVVEEAARSSVSPNKESEVTWLTSPPYLQLERSCRSDRPVRSCYWWGRWEERGRPGRRAGGNRGGQRRPAQTRTAQDVSTSYWTSYRDFHGWRLVLWLELMGPKWSHSSHCWLISPLSAPPQPAGVVVRSPPSQCWSFPTNCNTFFASRNI